jgi:hypothetical protein
MTNAFEYGDEMLEKANHPLRITENSPSVSEVSTNQPYLNLAT